MSNGNEFELDSYTEYEMIAKVKDEDGVEHVERHQLRANRYVRDLGEQAIEDLLINQAKPTKITPTRRAKPKRPDRLAIALPDAQIPFQDEKAIALAHIAVRETMPDDIILLGDMVDFPGISRFLSHPEHLGKVQESLDRTHEFMAQLRADAPDSRMYYIYGNHEQRLQNYMIKHNAELLGIKRANAQRELGVMTLEFLLRMGELEVEAVGGYPNGALWLQDHTVAIHGNKAKQKQSTSLEYLKDNPYVNTIHGHSHRAEIQWRTTPTDRGYEQRFAMSPGTLADIQGSVPSYNSTIDEHNKIVPRAENWQQAVGLLYHNERLARPSLAVIQDDTIMIEDKIYGISQAV